MIGKLVAILLSIVGAIIVIGLTLMVVAMLLFRVFVFLASFVAFFFSLAVVVSMFKLMKSQRRKDHEVVDVSKESMFTSAKK